MRGLLELKIHNETCLLFSVYILAHAALHITLSSHNLVPALKDTADKCTCAWEFKKPILSFVSLYCIQTKINEQFGLSMQLVLTLTPRSFFLGTQVLPSPQNQDLQIPITCGSGMVDEEPLSVDVLPLP